MIDSDEHIRKIIINMTTDIRHRLDDIEDLILALGEKPDEQ